MMSVVSQLALNIQLRDDATFVSFYAGNNREALTAVSETSQGLGEPFLYLWGQVGAGRTHLLQAACHQAAEKGLSAFYLSFATVLHCSPAMLNSVEEIPLICMDDLESIAGNVAWEEALLHLFNRIRANQGRLLVTADCAPAYLPMMLPDLKSRLAWGVVYQLHRLTDVQKIEALQLRANQRGLELTKSVGQFLLSRCSRNMAELCAHLEQLDKASLMKQRRLTIPFVKQVLGL